MNNYLLKYEDALEIAKKYYNRNFWESQYQIGDFKLSAFNYFICGWNDFATPLTDKPHVNAFDMRGTTFVFDENGKLWKTFYMLPKFFNLNQVESTQYSIIYNKKISNISFKEDGSLVAFMELPNRELFTKTIGSFTSEQATAAYNLLLSDKNQLQWVKDRIQLGYTPLFEYVSWDNRIVLKYSKPELKFIGLRDNYNGAYYPAGILKTFVPFDTIKSEAEDVTLDEIIKRAKVKENIEGWVVRFTDGQLIKIKTDWYFRLHGLRTQNIFREDFLIKNYLELKLDDIVSQLDPDNDKDAFIFIEIVKKAVNNKINNIDKNINKLVEIYKNDCNSNWIKFATENYKEAYFPLVKSALNNPAVYNLRKVEYIINLTKKLKRAKDFVERWNF